ncbi:MAG: putative protein N(5)-glutamine methyltransferase [Nocardioides sp.]
MSDPAAVVSRLRAAGCVFAEEEAALLLAAASGQDLEALVVRRVAGEPLEHLLGWVSFAGARYVVTPGVFVPRRRSELLVATVVQWQSVGFRVGNRPTATGLPVLRVVELCCGAGAIGAAISERVPGAEVWAADIDPVAVACARRNLLPERVVEGDLYDALPARLRGRIDVVVVNAPYVPTDAIATMPPEARDHEPRVALDGGADGLDLHRRVVSEARPWLAPGGTVVIETSRAQADGTATAARAAGLTPRVVTDDELDATAVVATLPSGKKPGPPYAGPL